MQVVTGQAYSDDSLCVQVLGQCGAFELHAFRFCRGAEFLTMTGLQCKNFREEEAFHYDESSCRREISQLQSIKRRSRFEEVENFFSWSG